MKIITVEIGRIHWSGEFQLTQYINVDSLETANKLIEGIIKTERYDNKKKWKETYTEEFKTWVFEEKINEPGREIKIIRIVENAPATLEVVTNAYNKIIK